MNVWEPGKRVRHSHSVLGEGVLVSRVEERDAWRVRLDRGGQVVWEAENLRSAESPGTIDS